MKDIRQTSLGASSTSIALVGVGVILFIVFTFVILGYLGRTLGISSPRVQQVSAAAEPEQKIQLVNTDTRLIVEELPPGNDLGVHLGDIVSNPRDYLGQKVQVNGYINRSINKWGFEMTETKDDHKDLLVIALPQFLTESQVSSPYAVGTPVSVEGTVKYFTRGENENSLGTEKLDNPLFGSIFGRYVIVAEKILKVE